MGSAASAVLLLALHATSSDEISLWVEIVSTLSVFTVVLLHVNLVSEETSDTAEALHELETFLRFISDELDSCSVILIVVTKPLAQRVFLNYFQVNA